MRNQSDFTNAGFSSLRQNKAWSFKKIGKKIWMIAICIFYISADLSFPKRGLVQMYAYIKWKNSNIESCEFCEWRVWWKGEEREALEI